MSKQIQPNEEIYIAPEIKGKYNEIGKPVAIDERNCKELNPRDIDDKIVIYEREVKDWFLKPASELIEQDNFNNAFIVIMICMSYFEGVEQYKTGVKSDSRSKECFKDSIKRIYPKKFQDKQIEELYSKSRCGLFHNGMVKGGVVFKSDYPQSIEFETHRTGGIEKIKINPKLLLIDIQNDFEKYINELKSTKNSDVKTLRENFDRMFTVL